MHKLGFAGASMTDGLLSQLNAAFRPDLFVNHYGSSEIYTFTIDQNAPAKPGSAGRAGINQMIRVVKLGAKSVEDVAATGEEGEIIALLASDEAFEGYWRRPEADAKAVRQGWYFTGDTGYLDADRDLFVTGRVDDMIITGGENVSPVEIEAVCRCIRRCRRSLSSVCPTSAGVRSSPPSSNVADRSRRGSRLNSAASRASPISNARAAMCSSPTSRNHRWKTTAPQAGGGEFEVEGIKRERQQGTAA